MQDANQGGEGEQCKACGGTGKVQQGVGGG
jgi:hypothetical protein